MRLGLVFAALLLAAGGAAAALQFGLGEVEPAPLADRTRAVLGQAEGVTLEKAADYWLGTAEKRQSDGIAGSGAALAAAIRLGRLEALRSGTEPVPNRLKKSFRAHYPDAVLDGARWTIAEPGSRLGRVLARWPVKEGAVTLGNVIVFKTRNASRNDALFAHELAHVGQYDKLGIDGFARRYAADPEPIEEEARTKARRVVRSL